MTSFNVVGQRHVRLDAVEKVTGRSTYASDVYLPGMLMCKLLTSTRSHARIVSIDTSEASRLPGVRAIITGKDFPDVFFGSGAVKDRRIMARDQVFYVGEAVAAVAADDEMTAQEALDLGIKDGLSWGFHVPRNHDCFPPYSYLPLSSVTFH